MGHCGQHVLYNLHKHVDEVPQLRSNAFYKCPSCMTRKLGIKQPVGNNRRKHTKQQHVETVSNLSSSDKLHNNIHIPDALPGQNFHMDFGFVRGSEFKQVKDGITITSIDGYNCYLIIIDRATRYTWIFLQSSKDSPLTPIKLILSKFKSTHPHRTVRTD